MELPWYCGYCSRWQPSEYRLCPTCGRSGQGRVCRKCKAKVPGYALFCPACGGDHFIEPAGRSVSLTRTQRLVRAGVGLVAIVALVLLLPRLVAWGCGVAINLAVYIGMHVLLFLLLTALLPDPLRSRIRAGAWWLVRTATRLIGNLFH